MPKETENSIEGLFNLMKSLGNFTDYANYQDYRRRKFGIFEDSLSPSKKEKERQAEYKKWEEGLIPEERQQYLKIFGD